MRINKLIFIFFIYYIAFAIEVRYHCKKCTITDVSTEISKSNEAPTLTTGDNINEQTIIATETSTFTTDKYNDNEQTLTATYTPIASFISKSTEALTLTTDDNTNEQTTITTETSTFTMDKYNDNEQTVTTTYTPIASLISEDLCCSSGGPGYNGTYTVNSKGWLDGPPYKTITSPTYTYFTAEDCCRACYEDSSCVMYYLINTMYYSECYLYNNKTICNDGYLAYFSPDNKQIHIGNVGCNFCRP
ncbi:30581_t:CDS:1 [Gigaspora margarita]|uniref:30581_t:CDS:1 n=1 Tax=Gigaspora margarita TaxID=4874 RepID=A0ABM8VY96_GIGMA|nr:30581_t:CDS:1 [Gigaspora margarita]